MLEKAVTTKTVQSRASGGSYYSENRPNFILQNVSKHLQRFVAFSCIQQIYYWSGGFPKWKTAAAFLWLRRSLDN